MTLHRAARRVPLIKIFTQKFYTPFVMRNLIQACRICLKTSCRLFHIRALGLGETFMRLSGVPVESKALPQTVCAVCAVQLRKARQLHVKSKCSQSLLLDLFKKKSKATLYDVAEIERVRDPLRSREFVTTYFAPNHCDLIINDDDQSADSSISAVKMEDQNETQGDDTIVYKSEESIVTVNETTNHPFSNSDVIKSEMPDVDGMETTENDEETNLKREVTSQETHEENELHTDNSIVKVEIDTRTDEREFEKRETKRQQSNKLVKNKTAVNYNSKLLNEHYKVKKLSLEGQILELQKVKLKGNYIKSPYKCESCYKGFKEEVNYTAHLVKHSESSGPEECPVCHIRFPSRRDGRNHVAAHTTVYTCKTCPYQTQNRKDAIKHIDWHRGTVYRCDLCTDAVFDFETSLHRHRRKHHPSPKSCALCGAGCVSETTLRLHYQWKHAGHAMTELPPEGGPRCQQCELTFASEEALAKHQRLQHDQSRCQIRNGDGAEPEMFVCDDCGEAFSAPHLLRGHLWRAHGRGPPAKSGPRRRTSEPRQDRQKLNVQCHVCGKIFHCAATLRYHVEEHEGSVNHACPQCGKTFKNRARMRLHWRQHSARYACPVCQRVFNCASNRDRHHKSVHATARDVQCGFCDKAFTSQRLRRQHELHVHMQKEWPKRVRSERVNDRVLNRNVTRGDENTLSSSEGQS